jgi:hypothetical protein
MDAVLDVYCEHAQNRDSVVDEPAYPSTVDICIADLVVA